MALGLTGKVSPRRYNARCTVYRYSGSGDTREETALFEGWCRVAPKQTARLYDVGDGLISESEFSHVIYLSGPVSLLTELLAGPTYVELHDGQRFSVIAWTTSENRAEIIGIAQQERPGV